MSNVPEGMLLWWIERERDAVYAAKLAILRVSRVEDIEHFGACLREHERHLEELEQLLSVASSREPAFATSDASIIGALADERSVLAAMRGIEEARVRLYDERSRWRRDALPHVVDALLERHATDARARLEWLRQRVEGRARTGAAA